MAGLWSKYRALPASTRIGLGGGVIAYALIAQALADKAEAPLGLMATDEDMERLRALVPRVRTVERGEGS